MMKSMKSALFGRNKPAVRPFKDYYADWIDILKTTHLPLLRRHLSFSATTNYSSKLLSVHVDLLHRHFQSYYQTLDIAASYDVAQVLFPDWRNPIEKPFLWLGDLHPYLFTTLVRSFIQSDGEETDETDSSPESELRTGKSCDFLKCKWPAESLGKAPSETVLGRIDQIECGLRLMVPALADRAKKAQAKFIARVGKEWWQKWGNKTAINEAAAVEMEELVGVFADANRLRSNVMAEIVSAVSVHQAALFLEGLAQFLVGIREKDLLKEFEHCKIDVNKVIQS